MLSDKLYLIRHRDKRQTTIGKHNGIFLNLYDNCVVRREKKNIESGER
jgi:hypothetical protein